MAAFEPNVQHFYNGDHALTQALGRRLEEVRRAVIALQQTFSQSAGQPAQLQAEIRLFTSPAKDSKDVFTVTVTDPGFDVSALPLAKASPSHPPVSTSQPGYRQTAARRPTDSHDPHETPASKKPRSGSKNDPLPGDESGGGTKSSADEALAFMRNWHREWTQQGGWLWDVLNTAGSKSHQDVAVLESRLATAQDALGHSINAATASTRAELESVKNLIPWLEQCRKINADKVDAREEMWRSSSATFHDQARRDREAAEKRIEDKLDKQAQLLTRIARASGVNLHGSAGDEESSLGAQLTAELNREIARAEKSDKRKLISMDDDDDDNDR